MCAKLHTVAASNNRVHMPWSLYYCLFAPHICMVLFFTHIPFVVNHTFNATPPERLQHFQIFREKDTNAWLKHSLAFRKSSSGRIRGQWNVTFNLQHFHSFQSFKPNVEGNLSKTLALCEHEFLDQLSYLKITSFHKPNITLRFLPVQKSQAWGELMLVLCCTQCRVSSEELLMFAANLFKSWWKSILHS